MTILNGFVGWLVLTRGDLQKAGSGLSLFQSLPSFILSGALFRVSQHPDVTWTWLPNSLFAIGSIWTILSFSYLGKSFAILPAVRSLVHNGPYQWVRHPAYLGELLLVLACALAASSLIAFLLLSLLIPCLILRILAEEKLLSNSMAGFALYQQQVRWRLFPRVW